VIAKNAAGWSKPSPPSDKVRFDLPGTPGKPGRPTIAEYDVDHINIEWETPKNTGDSPVTHYDINRKDDETEPWIKVNTIRVFGTTILTWRYLDTQIQSNHSYKYQIVAMNKAGRGKPSDTSKIVYVNPKLEEPNFEVGNMIKVYTEIGKSIDVVIPYVGTPYPEVKWIKDGKEMIDIQVRGQFVKQS